MTAFPPTSPGPLSFPKGLSDPPTLMSSSLGSSVLSFSLSPASSGALQGPPCQAALTRTPRTQWPGTHIWHWAPRAWCSVQGLCVPSAVTWHLPLQRPASSCAGSSVQGLCVPSAVTWHLPLQRPASSCAGSPLSVRLACGRIKGTEARVQKVQRTCSQSQRVEPGPRVVPEQRRTWAQGA